MKQYTETVTLLNDAQTESVIITPEPSGNYEIDHFRFDDTTIKIESVNAKVLEKRINYFYALNFRQVR